MSEGIMHGPYGGLSDGEVRDYIQLQVGVQISDFAFEKLHDGVQSQYQYEQHCLAVQDAIKAGRIEQGIGLSVVSHSLEPWTQNTRAEYYNL